MPSDEAPIDEAPAEASEPATPDGEAVSPDPSNPQLAFERARDSEANKETRPPDDETITFRSVTIVEIYSDQAVDSLTTAIGEMHFVNLDEPLASLIEEARRGNHYWSGTFSLASTIPRGALYRTGRTPCRTVSITFSASTRCWGHRS